jgi:hypothetical protein
MTTMPLAEPQTSQAKHAENTIQPAIGYRQAMRSRFTLDQNTYTVAECPGDVFQRFITDCGCATCQNRSWTPRYQQALVHLLERNCSDVARWYALETLLAHHVSVPLVSALIVSTVSLLSFLLMWLDDGFVIIAYICEDASIAARPFKDANALPVPQQSLMEVIDRA